MVLSYPHSVNTSRCRRARWSCAARCRVAEHKGYDEFKLGPESGKIPSQG
jgi:hypothetical protein